MKINLYSFKDNVSGNFSMPFAQQNDEVCLRSLRFAVNTPSEHIVYTSPKDISVYCLGVFDDCSGLIEKDLRFLANAIDFKQVASASSVISDSEVSANE